MSDKVENFILILIGIAIVFIVWAGVDALYNLGMIAGELKCK